MLKPLAWLPRGPQGAAYAAALGLVVIQVGIGILIKTTQNTGGKYAFSPSASVAISEFLKMCLSCAFFWRECRERAADGTRPKDGDAGGGEYAQLPVSRADGAERNSLEEKASHEATSGSGEEFGQQQGLSGAPLPFSVRLFWSYIRSEVSAETRYGFCNLALFYVLINNSIFICYKMADPGTIQLTKSGVTLITALVMIASLGAKVSKTQWMAIFMQLCGLIVTQYNPNTGMNYPLSTYLVLVFQVFLSASSGVYNQVLLKREKSSLHANNMTLYAAGAFFNVLVHIVVGMVNPDEPGFLVGYDSIGAIMVIMSNVFIGLAITAVYKYADAVIKCLATSIATGILLYLSSILFGTPLGFLAVPGTLIVCIASWLYLDNPAPREAARSTSSTSGGEHPQKRSILCKPTVILERFPKAVLAVSTFLSILIIAWLTASEVSMPDVQGKKPAPAAPDSGDDLPGEIVESPFKNSLVMVRWNSVHPERIPLIRKYEPFFHTVHISMPAPAEVGDDLGIDDNQLFHNITHDQYSGIQMHNQVAWTMQLLLDQHPEIDGLLYFHFDAWVDPLRYAHMNLSRIWYPTGQGAPAFRCLKNHQDVDWWGWGINLQDRARKAGNDARNLTAPSSEGKYTGQPDEFCMGWSDIYWVPRRYFADYILLTRDAFGGAEERSVWHELAIPTMLHMIEQTYRKTPFDGVIDDVGPCWGSCCHSNPTSRDVLWFRCGHRLNYLTEAVTSSLYSHLDSEAGILGKRVAGSHVMAA